MSRIEIEDAAPGVRVMTFNRPEVRNAFDTVMYLELTTALHAADADDAVGAVVLTGQEGAFTSGADLAEMAAIATGTKVNGSDRGFQGLLECFGEISVPLLAAVNGVAVGLGFTMLAHCDLVLVDRGARLRVPFSELGVPPEAASSFLFPAVMGWQRAARVLLTSEWVDAEELVDLGLALQVCEGGTARDETVALAARIAAFSRALDAGHYLAHAGGPARRRTGREPARASRLRLGALRRRRARHPRRVRREGGARLTVRLGITAALTDRDLAPATLAVAVEELGFDSLWLPEHTHLPLREDLPPALVEGVRLDDYKRCLDPLIALATAATVTTRIGLGTGILLAAQHDPILLAKEVATLDHLSGGRVTLGVGYGWNRAEAEDHGVDFGRRRAVVGEHLAAMEAIWSHDEAEFHGDFVDFGPTWSWPKPVQQPACAHPGRRWTHRDGARRRGGVRRLDSHRRAAASATALPRLRALAEQAGRDPMPSAWSPSGPSPTRGSSSTSRHSV